MSSTPTSGTIKEPKKTRISRIIKCGVCEQDIESSDWVVHIRQEHHYIAWQRGETPLVSLKESQDNSERSILPYS